MKLILPVFTILFTFTHAYAGQRTKEYKAMYDKLKAEEVDVQIKSGKLQDNKDFWAKEVNSRLEGIIKGAKNNKEDDFIAPFSNKRKLEFMEERSKANLLQGFNYLKCLTSKGEVRPSEFWEYTDITAFKDNKLTERVGKPGKYLSFAGRVSLKKGDVRVSPAGIEFTFAIDQDGKIEVTDLVTWDVKDMTGCSRDGK